MTVEVLGKGTQRIDELKRSDWVLAAGDKWLLYVPVEYWLHRVPGQEAEFNVFETENGKTIKLTDKHYIYKGDCTRTAHKTVPYKDLPKQPVTADQVHAGDCLFTIGKDNEMHEVRVVRTSKITQSGIYAPMTSSGRIIVNGVHASCHNIMQETTTTLALFEYVTKFNSVYEMIFGSDTEEVVETPFGLNTILAMADMFIPESLSGCRLSPSRHSWATSMQLSEARLQARISPGDYLDLLEQSDEVVAALLAPAATATSAATAAAAAAEIEAAWADHAALAVHVSSGRLDPIMEQAAAAAAAARVPLWQRTARPEVVNEVRQRDRWDAESDEMARLFAKPSVTAPVPEQEAIKQLREENAKSSPFRVSRACGICTIDAPRKRAVLTHCGHSLCLACAKQMSIEAEKFYGSGNKCIRCPYCRSSSKFVPLFEDFIEG